MWCPQGSWGPAMDLYRVLVAIRQLLAEPNPRDPLEVAIVSVQTIEFLGGETW